MKRAEKALLNERIRPVNNTINMLKTQIDTCMEQLETRLEERVMEDCKVFIKNKREARHNNTKVRQILKFEQLCHKNKIQGGHSNYHEKQDGCSNVQEGGEIQQKWVINTTYIALTEAQESLLAHGPNYAVVPKTPTYYRCDNSSRENMPAYGQGRSRRIERGGQGHPQKD